MREIICGKLACKEYCMLRSIHMKNYVYGEMACEKLSMWTKRDARNYTRLELFV